MKAVNDIQSEGHFKRFGLSNFIALHIYNAVHRPAEPELFLCLRKYRISFYAFNSIGGRFFTGNYPSPDSQAEEGSRTAAGENSLTTRKIALRWMSHHSLTKCEHRDSVLIGASSLKHMEEIHN
ncbi:hypothetical protein GYMLUDRAFT_66810 [Collybiopsis luxurians FD-317 M1]|nr:hypothetical protein GYMLUDRAFT_66810 [Collybiopsis luxurians FD-317 M1]